MINGINGSMVPIKLWDLEMSRKWRLHYFGIERRVIAEPIIWYEETLQIASTH